MNHYERLEISPNASPAVIKAAYKSLMQFYHPDRNPGNAENAKLAILIGQAYEVLSDPGRRAAYDLELQQLTARVPERLDRAPKHLATRAAAGDNNNTSSSYLWLLPVLMVALFGLVYWSYSGKRPPVEAAQQETHSPFESNKPTPAPEQTQNNRNDATPSENQDAPKAETSGGAQDIDARTIPVYLKDLTVILTNSGRPAVLGNSLKGNVHLLSIPRLGVTVGAFDSDKFIQYIKHNDGFISQKLEEKLAYAKYEELAKPSGEAYLKNFILDSMDEIIESDRFKEYPSPNKEAPSHYGVVEVLIPESFTVR